MKLIGVLAAFFFAAAFVGGAGGGTAKTDLSTRAGVTQYLAAHGIDPTGIVIQRGARNYAGPSCPGKGWTCSRAARVVQISRDSENRFRCTPSNGGLADPPNSCLIVQISSGGRNDARCSESSREPVVAQSCDIRQTNTTGDNRADISQSVNAGPTGQGDDNNDNGDNGDNGDNNDGERDSRRLAAHADTSTEDATQTASVSQTNGSGSNASRLKQSVHLRSSAPDATGIQSQDGHQSASVSQTSDTGDNASLVNQSLAEQANAVNAAVATTQSQNGQRQGPNTDAFVSQSSTLGRNLSFLNQAHDLRMQSKGIAVVDQSQSTPNGGLNGHVDQLSSGLSISLNTQDERQRMDANDATSQSQAQYGPSMCCSIQQSNTSDVFNIGQRSTQTADPGAFQSNAVVGNCDTSGNCSVDQLIRQNGTTTTNSCTDQHCHTGLVCGEGGCVPCTGSGEGGCPQPPGTTFTLTVVVVGGNGETDHVTSEPGSIDCGPPTHTTCTNDFTAGTVVGLTALTSCDFGNGTWTGADSSDGNVASVKMTSDRTVTAQYGSAC